MDIVNQYFQRCESHRSLRTGFSQPVPWIVCRDGFSISVQAGFMNYSEPRNNQGPWHRVECGFPSETELDLMPWAETEDDPMNTVYAYVPVDKVCEVLEKHGGIDYDAIALRLLEKRSNKINNLATRLVSA